MAKPLFGIDKSIKYSKMTISHIIMIYNHNLPVITIFLYIDSI